MACKSSMSSNLFSVQVTQQSTVGAGHSQCLQTEFGEVCLVRAGEQSLPQPFFQGSKGVAAAAAAKTLKTEFEEVKLVHPAQPKGSLPTEFGEVEVTGEHCWHYRVLQTGPKIEVHQ